MRKSHLFTKTRKKAPSDEVSKNAKLLIQAGFVHKEMAGVYGYLPLGLKVRDKIEAIIRHEMNAVGGQEVKLTALQRPELWQETNRWSDEAMDVWFKTQLKEGGELGLAPTHEEPLTQALTQHINSYRDLPRAVYQFQTKFRNELRAKSGLMRGREFLMKDLYSFSKSQAEHDEFYADMKAA
jgi:prolyl-tRNA synthetase